MNTYHYGPKWRFNWKEYVAGIVILSLVGAVVILAMVVI